MKRMRIGVVSIGLCLIIGGALAGITPFTQYWRSKHVPHVTTSPFLGTAAAAPAPQKLITGKPVRIIIPSLNIDLPVIDGYYNAQRQQWTLTSDKAQYATMTSPANNAGGNTFIYGHNRKGVFNTLNQIKVGDTVTLTTDNGHTFTYSFRGALETIPTDDSLFHYQGKPILTVQTCSGVWYQNRQLFTFDLEHAE
ncbi:MAG TPA: sortase [Candidatus Saccharimonadales bacterium]|nr:sortase [Candidatus Saccharimonadales bacterium]